MILWYTVCVVRWVVVNNTWIWHIRVKKEWRKCEFTVISRTDSSVRNHEFSRENGIPRKIAYRHLCVWVSCHPNTRISTSGIAQTYKSMRAVAHAKCTTHMSLCVLLGGLWSQHVNMATPTMCESTHAHWIVPCGTYSSSADELSQIPSIIKMTTVSTKKNYVQLSN